MWPPPLRRGRRGGTGKPPPTIGTECNGVTVASHNGSLSVCLGWTVEAASDSDPATDSDPGPATSSNRVPLRPAGDSGPAGPSLCPWHAAAQPQSGAQPPEAAGPGLRPLQRRLLRY